MIHQHVLVGSVIIALCVLLVSNEQRILERTVKGQRLIRWFGPDFAPWVFRGLMAGGIIFGGLLAAGIIRPMTW